jgi:hypothetical protein
MVRIEVGSGCEAQTQPGERTITIDRMTLKALLEKGSDDDLLREMIGFVGAAVGTLGKRLQGRCPPVGLRAVRNGSSANAAERGRERRAEEKSPCKGPSAVGTRPRACEVSSWHVCSVPGSWSVRQGTVLHSPRQGPRRTGER